MSARPQISREAIDRIRAKIDASRLINRLQEFALGDLDTVGEVQGAEIVYRQVIRLEDGTTKRAMSKEQIQAAKVLLERVLPTPQSIDINTSETKTFVIRAPEPSKSMDEWLNHYGPKTIEGEKTPTKSSQSGSPSPARKQLS